MLNKEGYSKLPGSELSPIPESPKETTSVDLSESEQPCCRYESPRRGRLAAIFSVGVIFGASVVFVIVSICLRSFHQIPSTPTDRQSFQCGNSTAQARALGCEFDLLSYSWMPSQCLERDTSAEFKEWLMSPDRVYGAWPFYEEEKGQNWIPDEEALSERVGVSNLCWTTREEHLGHCLFMMRRLHRIAHSGGKLRMNSRFGAYGHTRHCSELALGTINGTYASVENGGIESHFGIGFTTC